MPLPAPNEMSPAPWTGSHSGEVRDAEGNLVAAALRIADCQAIAALPKLLDALHAVLLFHRAGAWTADDRLRWWNITQSTEATTAVLCNTVRAAIAKATGQPAAPEGAR